MTFLPIVGRELRVAARKRFTYWGRFSAALLALLIFGGMQTIFLLSRGGAPFSIGWFQFQVMKWFCFAVASVAGLFLTSDTLSEEKREGTLGLLFLTDLRGYDVVFGKLISHSTQAFYGLLAVFPVLGLTILLGGVSGSEFGRTSLVICNTLFLSLSLGLLVSSVSRDAMKALNGTLLLILILTGGMLLVDLGLAGWDATKFKPRFSLASPGYLLATTSAYLPKDWWPYLGLQHLLGWIFLALSSVCIPRAWQEKTTKSKTARRTIGTFWGFDVARARAKRREKLLNKNPVLWLASRNQWLNRLVWIATLLSLGLFACKIIYHSGNRPSWLEQLEGVFLFLVHVVFALWVASQASRFFVEAFRNGALELILVTPATPAQIVKGQWRALCRTFLIPGLLLLLISVAGDLIQMREILKNQPANFVQSSAGGFNFIQYQIVGMSTGIVTYAANLFAVAWFGMWIGMTTRKPSIAILKTICFVVVLPWLALMFIQGLTMFALMRPSWGGIWPFWSATVLVCVLNLGKDLFFIFWSRQRLTIRFRQQAAQEGRVPRQWQAPLQSAAEPGVPPVVDGGILRPGTAPIIASVVAIQTSIPTGGTTADTKASIPPQLPLRVKSNDLSPHS